MNKKSRLFYFLLISLLCSISYGTKLYPLTDKRQEAQFSHLLKELRCLVCQNQDLSDSHAPLAQDLRQQIYHFVLSGKSDSEIIQYMTERYGDFILFNPPMKGLTLFLWLGPFLFLIFGFYIFWLTSLKRKYVS